MSEKNMEDRFAGGISLSVIVNLITLVAVLWISIVSLSNVESQLIEWLNDAEIERKENQEKIAKYHSDILVMIGGLNDVNGRVHEHEQYHLKKDPDYSMPVRKY